jgi:hypothetical protein
MSIPLVVMAVCITALFSWSLGARTVAESEDESLGEISVLFLTSASLAFVLSLFAFIFLKFY